MSDDLFHRRNFDRVVSLLKKGEVCILPTDTIPGFSATTHAAEKITTLKRRSAERPFVLLFPDYFSAERVVVFSDLARFLFSHTSDPMTLVLPRRRAALLEFFPREFLLAVRIPRTKTLVKFLHVLGEPLCSTSVNLSGEAPICEAATIAAHFPQIPFFAGSGSVSGSPSGMVKVEGETMEILRGEDYFCHKIRQLQSDFFRLKKMHDSLFKKGEFWEK